MSAEQPDIEQLEHDAAAQREQLGRTVDQIAAKADVKSHAQRRVREIRSQLPFVGEAEPKDAAQNAAHVAKENRAVWIVGAGVAAVVVVGALRRRKRRQRERELQRLRENPLAAMLLALGRAREIAERTVAR